jgi:flagellar M-ring protein FliF
VPSYQVGTSDGKSSYDKENLKQNYEYKTVETSTEKALGNLDPDKSSIAATLWYGRKVTDDTKLSDAFITELKANISNATGIPVSRVSVIKCKLPPEEAVNVPITDNIRSIIDAYGFYALMMLLVIALLVMAAPRRKKGGQLIPEAAAAIAAQLTGQGDTEILQKIPLDEKSELKLQIEKFAKEKPEAVAQLLKNWLSDEW